MCHPQRAGLLCEAVGRVRLASVVRLSLKFYGPNIYPTNSVVNQKFSEALANERDLMIRTARCDVMAPQSCRSGAGESDTNPGRDKI